MTNLLAPSRRLELVVFTWSGEPQRHRLPVVGEVRIGRDSKTNDICIQDASVSANHAILTVDSSLRIRDLGSTNGTILRRGDRDVGTSKTERTYETRHTGETFVVELGDRLKFGSAMAMVRVCQVSANGNTSHGGTWPYSPIVQHPAMLQVYHDALTIARSSSRACVLLRGETGVGKDVLARAIHLASPRAQGPFVPVNAGAIAETMFAREMFGHKKHAFTDAKTDEPGFFEAADGGTLFLDEIGDLPLSSQTILLRVLDDRRITRVGSTQSKLVNVRIIAATNQRLEECIVQGTFRRDLYHRLRGFELEIPPLRARPTDIIPMAEAFIEDECRAMEQGNVPRLSPQVVAVLEAYEFPGNVRELRDAMTHAVTYCGGKEILPEHLPKTMQETDKTDPMLTMPFVVEDKQAENSAEEERIRWALGQCGGNVTRAADLLGMARRTLFYKMNKYNFARSRKGVAGAHVKC